ncbi:ectodysplasin-A receptor-associated adapter protein-like [Xyrauchen texanus]|uniref:ectodysplasin-A receptor-associated adapter protein-like n=1 Tax=Xyrauchen texanus TaxID=154827 RepID=UPI002242BD97|nr:ectodysplasin-A receptor-associated adapter protein-like [Xyrauchen texanus]XP_052009772.1 ectodysplasin-A receptor-associated adapter protein-like [Xyrauchen texanus]
MFGTTFVNMTSLKAFSKKAETYAGRMSSEPVEDTDPSSFITEMSLRSNYPVQVTNPQDSVTLKLSSVPPDYLTPPADRIQQPVENDGSKFIPSATVSSDFSKEHTPLCLCSAPPPKISDLMNDEDLLYTLRLKLDPTHCTVKNWKNFASRWGMSYDELTLLEQRTHGSTYHSPTQEFLLRYNQKPVKELTELCQLYQRIDVLRLLQRWMENDWPSRWQKAH